MRCLVTGAGGLIGGHVVKALLDSDHTVRALVRPGGSSGALETLAVDRFEGDVLIPDTALLAACRNCDTVFHAAAYFSYEAGSAERLRTLAEVGTENVLKASAKAGVRRVVITSSSVVFGYMTAEAEPLDETAPIAEDDQPPYVAAKIAQHVRALAYADDLEILLACPTITVGSTATTLGPSNALIAAYLNDPFHCTYPGGCNIVGAQDVARGHVLLAARGIPGESYLLGSENLTWHDIHSLIAELSGVPPPAIELNHTMGYLAATVEELRAALWRRAPLSTREQAAMIGRYYWYSHMKAAQLGYAPASARTALTEAISWLVASQHIGREVRTGLRLSDDVYSFRARRTELNANFDIR
jgi:dihydroflavonol-4-reductase